MSTPSSNLLLASLSPISRDRILSLCKHVDLPVRTSLTEREERAKFAYFITSGIASVVVEAAEGGTAEVALIGHEGLVGAVDLLGPALTSTHCFVQVEASGYRMPFRDLRALFLESDEIRTRILETVQVQTLTMSQIAACNKLHEADARMARWLLMAQDRLQRDTLMLTQEFLAQMLGTQRTTVVMVAGRFQQSGLIEYKRGKVKILSREDLENAACECYNVTRRLLTGLYKQA